MLSKKQRAILKEIEKVTAPEEWNGLKGVYCLGSVKVQGRDVLGVYYGQFPKQTSSKKQALQFEINYKKYTVTECPIVFVDTMKNKKAHQFAFIVLHELGHHVDRTQNKSVLREGNKQQELFANTYAIERFYKWKEWNPSSFTIFLTFKKRFRNTNNRTIHSVLRLLFVLNNEPTPTYVLKAMNKRI